MTSAAKISQRRNEMRRGLICLLKFIDGDAEDRCQWLNRVKSGRLPARPLVSRSAIIPFVTSWPDRSKRLVALESVPLPKP
jgi:hypothetical protein